MKNSKPEYTSTKQRVFSMLALIVGGESVFFLPFILARVFRPTLLAVFHLTNFELGIIFSFYGMVAMVSYFLGGPLADRFVARKLMAVALAATALGGLVMATIPGIQGMKYLYGFWGATTILLFWAALIRATREWGGKKLQGSAFGLLDGGRGLASALIGTIGVAILAVMLPSEVDSANLEQRTEAFRYVILFVSAFTFCVSFLVYFALPKINTTESDIAQKISFDGIRRVIAMPVVWLQAMIIVCAYVAYKTTDDFSLYAKEVLYFNDVEAASIGTLSLWMRPVMAILAGIIADRFSASKLIIISFAFMILGGGIIGLGWVHANILWLFFIALVATSAGIYALRGLYFAIMEEGKIPLMYTGAAVGLISFIGYTPDVFMGPLMGYLLDKSPGAPGHQHLFMVFTLFSLLGLITAIWFRRIAAKKIVS